MLSNFNYIVNSIKLWLEKRWREIILFLLVLLISLLSFAAGFITAKLQEKQPLKIIENSIE